jgi:hypothetical protein
LFVLNGVQPESLLCAVVDGHEHKGHHGRVHTSQHLHGNHAVRTCAFSQPSSVAHGMHMQSCNGSFSSISLSFACCLAGGDQQQQQRRRSNSVYLPACWTWHSTDWQHQLPQLDWQVVSAAYQATHPGLAQQWAALFLQLGAVSVPPLVPSVVSRAELQQQKQQVRGAGDADAYSGSATAAAAAQTAVAAAAGGPKDVAGDAMDVEHSKEQPAATPAAAAAGTRTARRVKFEPADDETAARTGRKDEQGSSTEAALLDWCCPDLEALLQGMPAVQQALSSSSSSSGNVQSGDELAQHATLYR